MVSKPFRCSDCGSVDGYRSRPRNFIEKYVLPVLFLRPIRCAECCRRSYRPRFVQVRKRSASEVGRRAVA
jgi:hypothetical protein